MKRIIALFILLATVFAFSSCKEDGYPKVESTEEESETVMTLSYEGEEYNVPYELYRAFFLTYKSVVDEGNDSAWTGANKAEYVEKIDEIIIDRITDIYAIFHLAKKVGIDAYSSTIDDAINEYITASVDGGYIDSVSFEGFGGDYDKYLASLKALFLNYSVQVLMIRYSLVYDALEKYYIGTPADEALGTEAVAGKLELNEEKVQAFYKSDECVRIIEAFFPSKYFTKAQAEEKRRTIADKTNDEAVINYIISTTTVVPSEVKNGKIVARYSLDEQYYKDYTEAAFALENFETSKIVEIKTGYDDGYAVLYKTLKSDTHYEECYSEKAYAYLQNEIGKLINSTQESLKNTVQYTSVLENLDRSTVTMG